MKKPTIITHAEILSRAMDSIKSEIDYWEIEYRNKKRGGDPAFNENLKTIIALLYKKLEMLNTMYIFETGIE